VTFDATTLLFEMLNFLVLVWLLHRFLYRPVLAVLDRRRAGIARQLSEAQTLRGEAAALEQRYQERLTGWQHEREQARAALQAELGRERDLQLDQLRAELERERQRDAALEAQRAAERDEQAQRTALELSLAFVTRLLERLAGPALEARLLEVGLADLATLEPERRQAIADALRAHAGAVHVASAYPLAAGAREGLAGALDTLAGQPLRCDFAERPELLAGIRIDAGSWVLSANLREELKFFQEAGHDTGAAGA